MLEKQLLDRLLKKLAYCSLKLTFWDGETKIYGKLKKPRLHLTIKDKKFVKSLFKNPSLAAGEAYMDGTLLIDGPLDELSQIANRNRQAIGIKKAGRIYKKFNRNTKQRQPKLISYHYDLGNDFYKMWLDKETLGYTCSYYKSPKDTLEDGQRQKFDHVLNKLQIKPGQTLLDIGFGWGYLLIRAAKRFKTKGLGVSLSKEQVAYAKAWAKREKVNHLVDFELMNYQDIPKLKKQFDRIVSVGFFEHVGRGNHKIYFDIIDSMLKTDGISVLHCISQQTEEPSDPWFDKYIFPGGYIPSIREITAHLADYNFVLKDYENIGPHYIPTLQEWWKRFEKHKSQVIKMYDERFYRMWRFYLASSIAAFDTGTISLSQWTFTRVPGTNWPLTRQNIYKTNKRPLIV